MSELERFDQEEYFASLIYRFENGLEAEDGAIGELEFVSLSLKLGIKSSRIHGVLHRIRMLDGVAS